MNHSDHVDLLRAGVTPGGIWADLGAGTGAFTLALAELLGAGGDIYAVDRDAGALRELERAMMARYPQVRLHPLLADFTHPLDLPPLAGIVLANALHFVRDKAAALRQIKTYLRPGGRLLVVEYNTDSGTAWVPHPFSFATWSELAAHAGFARTQWLAARPSRFLREIYSALSVAP
jgi:ubiquinone/menaquinone biosynthesis C-methylase UbiE